MSVIRDLRLAMRPGTSTPGRWVVVADAALGALGSVIVSLILSHETTAPPIAAASRQVGLISGIYVDGKSLTQTFTTAISGSGFRAEMRVAK